MHLIVESSHLSLSERSEATSHTQNLCSAFNQWRKTVNTVYEVYIAAPHIVAAILPKSFCENLLQKNVMNNHE